MKCQIGYQFLNHDIIIVRLAIHRLHERAWVPLLASSRRRIHTYTYKYIWVYNKEYEKVRRRGRRPPWCRHRWCPRDDVVGSIDRCVSMLHSPDSAAFICPPSLLRFPDRHMVCFQPLRSSALNLHSVKTLDRRMHDHNLWKFAATSSTGRRWFSVAARELRSSHFITAWSVSLVGAVGSYRHLLGEGARMLSLRGFDFEVGIIVGSVGREEMRPFDY